MGTSKRPAKVGFSAKPLGANTLTSRTTAFAYANLAGGVPLSSAFRGAKDAPQSGQRDPAIGSDHFLSVLADRIAIEVAERVEGRLQKSVPVQKALFSVSEAALYIGRSKSAVQNMIHDRVLPVVRNGHAASCEGRSCP
jgi:hypothetical protein